MARPALHVPVTTHKTPPRSAHVRLGLTSTGPGTLPRPPDCRYARRQDWRERKTRPFVAAPSGLHWHMDNRQVALGSYPTHPSRHVSVHL